jgi:hypothetical protein
MSEIQQLKKSRGFWGNKLNRERGKTMAEKVSVKVHPNVYELSILMEEIGNGTIEIKIQNGIPLYITRQVQNISIGDRVRQKVS